jgi:hypothetical protein
MKFDISSTRRMRKAFFTLALLVFFSACKRTETLATISLEEIAPLKIGKYITYRLDSLVFVNSGKTAEIHRYRIKHVVEQEIKDNLNRPAWRVVTYITDSLGNGPWVPSGVYIVTPVDKRLEVNENNLRVTKIQLPVKEGFTWKGNTYLPNRPYNPDFPISIDGNMSLWDFTYETINIKERIGSVDVENVTTILHIDASENVPIIKDTVYASRELSIEKYAKNIGLVYREMELWENQPRPRTTPNPNPPPASITTYDPVRIGFGVKMWMIDKN